MLLKILHIKLFLFASTFLCSNAMALPLSYNPGKTVTTTVTDPFYEDVLIEFVNTGNTTITLSWIGYEESKTDGWQIGMCNNGECRADVLIPGSIGTLQPSESGFLKLHVSAVNITGSARIKFILYDKNDSADADTLVFNVSFVSKTSGCDETCNYQDLIMQQNDDGIIFSGAESVGERITVNVTDLAGREIFTLPFASEKLLPLAGLKPGVYVITLTDKLKQKRWQQKIFRSSY